MHRPEGLPSISDVVLDKVGLAHHCEIQKGGRVYICCQGDLYF